MIDTGFDVYTDTPCGKDPDSHSPTLRRYHARLWSKALPSGHVLSLQDMRPKGYLAHRFENGMELHLSSDSIGHSYRSVRAMSPVLAGVDPSEVDRFFALCSTVGAYILFPARKVAGRATINGARGMHARIKDRFDLTLECIRRHYTGDASPLAEALARYDEFFDLFGSFAGYVEFFLLQDLVDGDGKVRFVLPFQGFDGSPLPHSAADYLTYRDGMSQFIRARNERMAAWDRTH